jgi:alpha-galactosidase
MPIEDLGSGRIHLYTKSTSYIMQVDAHRQLLHVYWGVRIDPRDLSYPVRSSPLLAFSPVPYEDDEQYSLDVLPQEFPVFGRSDFRSPVCHLQYEDGSTVSEFVTDSYRLIDGKPALTGLPSLVPESGDLVSTIEFTLTDPVSRVSALLRYSLFDEFDVITRSVEWKNEGRRSCALRRALSMSVDFTQAEFQMLHLAGAWAREAEMVCTALDRPKIVSVESRRGATSHQAQPFVALARRDATLHRGEVYAVNLIYSGNFLAFAEVDQYRNTRMGIGINPFDFHWVLESGQAFQSPEAVLVFSNQGMSGISRHFHGIYQERLCPRRFRHQARPIALNTWEAAYFDINASTIEAIAESAADLGVELLVVDDGWFGHRDNDRSSLGDWYVDKRKFPDGLAPVVKSVKAHGLKFGLWVEPEMVSLDSDLFRHHPDWCVEVPDRPFSVARHQRVLDLSRDDVRTFIIDRLCDLIGGLGLDYLKWDMNRHLTEVGSNKLPSSRQRETAHRYILGLYQVLNAVTAQFPDLLIEGCSGGGGRFDAGMLAYCPQIWTSDNTDPAERLKIQQGTAVIYPVSAISAHVSDVPNHQTGRITPLQFRGHVAMSGVLGYELDPRKLSPEDRRTIREQITWYKNPVMKCPGRI